MKNLKAQIADAKYEISQRREAIKVYENLVIFLERQRVNCPHEWDTGIKGWEHEGVYCIHCGINDQYALTLQKQLGK